MNHFLSFEERSVQEKLANLSRPERVKHLAPKGELRQHCPLSICFVLIEQDCLGDLADLVNLAKTSFSVSMVLNNRLRSVITDKYFEGETSL